MLSDMTSPRLASPCKLASSNLGTDITFIPILQMEALGGKNACPEYDNDKVKAATQAE